MELTTQEIRDLQKAYDELRSEQETNKDIKKLYANMVSEFRHQAKTAEDLAKQLYERASWFEDKLRAL